MLKRLTTPEEAEWFFRLTIQLFNLSEMAFRDARDLEHFKRLQISLVESLRECRDVQLELAALIDSHTKEVESGAGGVDFVNGHVHVSNDIEPKLNRLFKDFFSKARTVLYHLVGQKDTPESVTYFLLDRRSISFVQAKEDAMFDKYAAKFLQDVTGEKAQALINMLRGDRATWLSTLIRTRDRINHDIDCPQLRMTYGVVGGKLRAGFPTVSGQELRQYLALIWENLHHAVEETVLVCIAMRMPDNFVLYRIPDDEFDPKVPFRWRFAFRPMAENR